MEFLQYRFDPRIYDEHGEDAAQYFDAQLVTDKCSEYSADCRGQSYVKKNVGGEYLSGAVSHQREYGDRKYCRHCGYHAVFGVFAFGKEKCEQICQQNPATASAKPVDKSRGESPDQQSAGEQCGFSFYIDFRVRSPFE